LPEAEQLSKTLFTMSLVEIYMSLLQYPKKANSLANKAQVGISFSNGVNDSKNSFLVEFAFSLN